MGDMENKDFLLAVLAVLAAVVVFVVVVVDDEIEFDNDCRLWLRRSLQLPPVAPEKPPAAAAPGGGCVLLRRALRAVSS